MSFAGGAPTDVSHENELSVFVLCTHAGTRTVTIAPDGSLQDYQPPLVPGSACDWCQTLCSVDYASASNGSSLLPLTDRTLSSVVAHGLLPVSLGSAGLTIRAPPVNS